MLSPGLDRPAGGELGFLCVALFSIVLIRLPVLFGATAPNRLLILAPFVFCVLKPGARRTHLNPGSTLALISYICVVVVSLIRGANTYSTTHGAAVDAITIVVLARFGVVLASSADDDSIRFRRLTAVALAPAAYACTNVALYISRAYLPFSLPKPEALGAGTPAELLGLMGVHTTRVEFPLASGVNSFAALAGAGFAASVLLALRRRSGPRRLMFAVAAVCLYALLLTDSRGAMLYALGVLMAFLFLGRVNVSAGLSALVPFSPAVVVAGLGFLANSGIGAFFSRSGDDLVSGNSRIFIWRVGLHVITKPGVDQLFGFGAGGQIASGASSEYAYLFRGTPHPYAYTTHNLAIQTVLDSGYLGLAALLGVTVATAIQLERLRRRTPLSPAHALLASLAVIMFCGATEALPTYYFMDTLSIAVIMFGVACGLVRSPGLGTQSEQSSADRHLSSGAAL